MAAYYVQTVSCLERMQEWKPWHGTKKCPLPVCKYKTFRGTIVESIRFNDFVKKSIRTVEFWRFLAREESYFH